MNRSPEQHIGSGDEDGRNLAAWASLENFNPSDSLLREYLETDSEDTRVEIVERSPRVTPFHLVNRHEDNNSNYDNSKVHFLFPGVLAGPDETFTPVCRVFGDKEDVYAPSRMGDFSAEHALNGIMEILEANPNYKQIEIFAVSIGASIAKVLDGDQRVRAMNESGREIKLTYYDAYDLDDVAVGINADRTSFMSAVERIGLKVAVSILPWMSKMFGSNVLQKGGAIGEDSSLAFVLGQFAALKDAHIVNPQTGEFYYKDHITGAIEAGTNGLDGSIRESKEHSDIFMDKNARIRLLNEMGIPVVLHAGKHGVTDDVVDDKSPRPSPFDAYRQLMKRIGW